jgi:hypothetical protein
VNPRHASRTRWSLLLLLASFTGCEGPRDGSSPLQQFIAHPQSGSEQILATLAILPPIIDGRLDEGIWQSGGYSNFVVVGQPNQPARRQTVVRVAYDATNLYIALSCPTDTSIGPPKVRHWQDDDEGIDDDESCRIVLCPEPAQPGVYFEWIVNPQAVVCDAQRHAGYPLSSTGWDAPTRAAAIVGRGVWTAELMIPLQQVGIPDVAWRINVFRHDAVADERSALVPIASATTTPVADRPPVNTVLQWPIPARPFLTAPLPIRQLRLADMEEAPDPWKTSGATVAASESHVVNGRRSLEVRIQPGGGRIGRALDQANFSGWQTIRLDAFVEGPDPLPLGLSLRDVLGHTQTAWFLARPGANNVALPLESAGAGLYLRSIRHFELIARGSAHVWIDNIRLEEDLLSFHEQPQRPSRQSRTELRVRLNDGLLAWPISTPSVAVDVTVPLFGTQKVRRLERRSPVPTDHVSFGADQFAGHDLRDPIRVTAFFRINHEEYFAFREVRMSQPVETLTFGPEDFPAPPASTLTTSRTGT